jgi:hypothetical protein
MNSCSPPVAVCGSSSTKFDPLGALVAGQGVAAVRDEVLRGDPAATSLTAGLDFRASSTAIEETFSPPEMITSFLRSEMTR